MNPTSTTQKERLDNSSQQQKVRIGLIGRVGIGKTLLLLSVFKHLFGRRSEEFVRPRLSRRPRRLLTALSRNRSRPDRSKNANDPIASETLTHQWKDGRNTVGIEWVSYPGEDLYRGEALDADSLRGWMATERLDFVIFADNPHEMFPALGMAALRGVMLKNWQLGRTLGESILIAAEVVFGQTAEGIKELGTGFEELPVAVSDVRKSKAGRSKDLATVLAREGLTPDDVAAVDRVLDLIVESCTADCGEQALIRDVLQIEPRCLVVFTHMDLSNWAGLTTSDYAAAAATLRPTNYDPRVSDIVFAKLLHLELQATPKAPVFVRGLLTDGGAALWQALRPRLVEWRDVAELASSVRTPRSASAIASGWAARLRARLVGQPMATALVGGLFGLGLAIACRLTVNHFIAEVLVFLAVGVGLTSLWWQSRAGRTPQSSVPKVEEVSLHQGKKELVSRALAQRNQLVIPNHERNGVYVH